MAFDFPTKPSEGRRQKCNDFKILKKDNFQLGFIKTLINNDKIRKSSSLNISKMYHLYTNHYQYFSGNYILAK